MTCIHIIMKKININFMSTPFFFLYLIFLLCPGQLMIAACELLSLLLVSACSILSEYNPHRITSSSVSDLDRHLQLPQLITICFWHTCLCDFFKRVSVIAVAVIKHTQGIFQGYNFLFSFADLCIQIITFPLKVLLILGSLKVKPDISGW